MSMEMALKQIIVLPLCESALMALTAFEPWQISKEKTQGGSIGASEIRYSFMADVG